MGERRRPALFPPENRGGRFRIVPNPGLAGFSRIPAVARGANAERAELRILGVETSCDETAAAVLEFSGDAAPRVLSNVVASQHEIHARFGGVVPELAARRHVEMIAPVLEAAFAEASVAGEEVDAVAVTRGPGLVVALLVGLSAAKGLAWSLGVPLIGVHHLDGHIHSLFLPTEDAGDAPPPFPHLGLVVSGGHTDFYRVDGHDAVRRLGGTLDDALGEAYDKVAAVMGLGYPGGPVVDRLHAEFLKSGGEGRAPVEFPRPLLADRPYAFSFSGLKTAVLNHQKERGLYSGDRSLPPWARPRKVPEETARAVAAGFQEAAAEVVVEKVSAAAREEELSAVSVSGGVAANAHLRARLRERAGREGWSLHFPARRFCTDNAAMIACAGGFRLREGGRGRFMDFADMDADPSWELEEASAA